MGVISPTLAVRNMKETLDFYQNSLGFKLGLAFPDASNPEYADLSKDGMVLMFLTAAAEGISGEEKLGAGVNLYMEIDGDIDEYYNDVKKKGVKIAVDIKDEMFGIRDFTVEDINGYRLTFNRPVQTGKTCMSCGMSMSQPQDFGGGDMSNIYCVNCTHDDGSLKSYEEALEGMVNFMMASQNMERTAAEVAAREYLSKMPAWSGTA